MKKRYPLVGWEVSVEQGLNWLSPRDKVLQIRIVPPNGRKTRFALKAREKRKTVYQLRKTPIRSDILRRGREGRTFNQRPSVSKKSPAEVEVHCGRR